MKKQSGSLKGKLVHIIEKQIIPADIQLATQVNAPTRLAYMVNISGPLKNRKPPLQFAKAAFLIGMRLFIGFSPHIPQAYRAVEDQLLFC